MEWLLFLICAAIAANIGSAKGERGRLQKLLLAHADVYILHQHRARSGRGRCVVAHLYVPKAGGLQGGSAAPRAPGGAVCTDADADCARCPAAQRGAGDGDRHHTPCDESPTVVLLDVVAAGL